jgi:DNA segregation ATPase FtsK/SpoIIIE, S-DNA-T family
MNFASKMAADRRREILGVLMLALTTLLFLALVTDGCQGHVPRPLDHLGEINNGLRKIGSFAASYLYLTVGHAAHILYFLTGVWGVMLLRHKPLDRLPTRLAGLALLAGAVAGLLHVDLSGSGDSLAGGAIGAFVAYWLVPMFGFAGTNIICVTIALIGVLLATELLFIHLLARIRDAVFMLMRWLAGQVAALVAGLRTFVFLAVERRAQARKRRRQERAKHARLYDADVAMPNSAPPKELSVPAYLRETVDGEPGDLSRIRVQGGGASNMSGAHSPYGAKAPEEPSAGQSSLAQELPVAARPVRQAAAWTADNTEPPDEMIGWPEGMEAPGDSEEGLEEQRARPAKPFKKPMPRRKTLELAELPPDYQYPKRYTKPPIDLFCPSRQKPVANLKEKLQRTSLLLEETLRQYSIDATVTDVTRGPTITRFELEPAPGTKVSRFLSLADELTLALKAHRVHVEAPIPGKGRVGIEVPNRDREEVVVRDLFESAAFHESKGVLTLALGKDMAGEVITADLASMPHLLVAGATGAGKTVCVKSLLASLLFTKEPEELQLMLVDPKMVELSIFDDIPHLITPVVTDPKKAATALNWLIAEMEERYRLFAHLRVRNIDVYNESVENGEIEMTGAEGGDTESLNAIRKLPYIVCVIDELADLMMLARAEVEDAIARLAQLARAVGIHLIIATQRPSVDVLTGVIKANFPARVSFQVSSRVDSRCILDEIGAERLIGKGDMLYLPAGQSKPTRIQGAFVSDEETFALISYLKKQAPPQYRDEIERFGKSGDVPGDAEEPEDDLFDEAVRVVIETGQASISMVQRRLRVGYTRAARLIDMMEMRGIVGPHVGSKAREILVESLPE